MDIPGKPYTILAIGPFAPTPDSSFSVVTVPVETLNDALGILKPSVWVPVPTGLCPDGGVAIRPERLKDLSPDGMLETVAYLKDLNSAREFIDKSTSEGIFPDQTALAVKERWPHLPLDLSCQAQTSTKTPSPHDKVDDILSMVAMGGEPMTPGKETQGGPAAWKTEIDNLLAKLMEAVFSDKMFRSFEASWRGIELLLKQGPAGTAKDTRLNITCASPANLGDVLDQLATSLASDPPDLVLIDIPFDGSSISIELMEKAAAFAEVLLVPTAITITPHFLNLNNWNELGRLPYLKHYIDDNAAYAKWNKLLAGEAGSWLTATCNAFLVRPPYGKEQRPRGVSFDEPSPLWVNPVWAVGTLAALSIGRYGWPSRLTDSENIRLEGLALNAFETDKQASTETVFTVDRLRQLGEIGLTPLTGVAMKDIAVLPSARTLSGESLSFQMFFSRLIGFLIRLREMTGASIAENDAGPWLKEALEAFFRISGGHLPGDLSVEASVEGGRLSFEIALTPAAIIPGGRRITFTFAW